MAAARFEGTDTYVATGDLMLAVNAAITLERFEGLHGEIPEEWLERQAELHLSEEEKARIEAMGGFEKLMEELRKRLEEQEKRHQGGNKWIGTAGPSATTRRACASGSPARATAAP